MIEYKRKDDGSIWAEKTVMERTITLRIGQTDQVSPPNIDQTWVIAVFGEEAVAQAEKDLDVAATA